MTDDWTPNRRTVFQKRRKPKMPKRECGNCSLCCKVMGVLDVEPSKQPHQWCSHAILPAKTGAKSTLAPCHGCSIYHARPESCRSFNCMWLVDTRFPDYWKPNKSKIVINAMQENGVSYTAFVVDPDYPLRWREEPYFSDIKHIARAGLEGRQGEKWTTIVVIKDQRIPIIGTPRLLRTTPAAASASS